MKSVGAKPSLRSRLTRRVVLPLVLTWALGTAVALSVANYFAGAAFDRALLDDAYAIATNVRIAGGGHKAPTLVTACTALPPEGAAAPAARQSRFRGPCWYKASSDASVVASCSVLA